MMKRRITILLTLLLAACAPTTIITPGLDAPVTSPPADSPTEGSSAMPAYAPQPNDTSLERGIAFVEEMGLLIRESYPPQIALGISGNVPTPCHQLRAAISAPDAENKINVAVYTVVDPNMLCAEVLKPFSETIELGTFPGGHYSVWVNETLAGEFDS